VISQCLLAGVNRDCLSGWGGVVHVISKDKLITRTLKVGRCTLPQGCPRLVSACLIY
jgi:hypothetical protein